MSATTKTNWFWSDWSGDAAVRRLTPAERGVWIDLLALAAVGNPKGYVCDARKRPLALAEIARFTNCLDLAELAALIDAIVAKGAASRDRRGRVFNRRMVRDARLGAIRSESGKKGISARLEKERQNPVLLQQGAQQSPERQGAASSDDSEFESDGAEGNARPRAREPGVTPSPGPAAPPAPSPAASALAASAPAAQTIALAAQAADAIGYAVDDPRRNTLPFAAQRWRDGGWDAALILATLADVARRAPQKPVAYYEPALAEAHARRARPLPVVAVEAPQTVRLSRPGESHASQNRSLVAAGQRAAARLAAALGAEPFAGDGHGADQPREPVLRLVSQVRDG